MHFEELQPSPSSLLESLRDIGYSIDTAMADVIDNSITAGAKTITIRFDWNDSEPWLSITDDGIGMSYLEVLHAMKLGSNSPLEERQENDLGRFGLGLKTASFSQCRQLTVISKKDDAITAMEWDLDLVLDSASDGWRIKVLNDEDVSKIKVLSSLYPSFSSQEHGTIILWRKLDRLDNFDSSVIREKKLNQLLGIARNHIEVTFHRFLNKSKGKKALQILFNGDQLVANDPFNQSSNATIELPEQSIYVDGKKMIVQPYVLPHYSKVSKEEYQKYAGGSGYLHNQGFYVYRNQRLIIKNTWFRLLAKDELTKLIRVRIDIPNTLDHVWKIDVKKSHASPPESVKNQLRQIISEVEYSGKRVFKQKGHRLEARVKEPLWIRTIASGKIIYSINKHHPLIELFNQKLGDSEQFELGNVLKSIEASFPSDLYFNDFANSPDRMEKPEIPEDEFESMLLTVAHILIEDATQKDTLKQQLLSIEPFASSPNRTINIIDKMEI
jgi:hypothetical protein